MCLQIAEDRTNPISTRLHAVELMTYFILDDDNWLETISQIVNNSLDYSNWEIVGEQFLLENRYTKTEISEITGALLNEKMIITIRSIFDIELKKEMKSEKIETTKEIGKGVQISDSTISSTTSPSNSSSSPSSSSFFSSSSSSSSSSISVSSSAPAVHLNKSIKQQHPPKRTTGHFLSLSNSLQRYLDVMDSLFEDSDSQQIHSFQPPIQTSSATPSSSSPSSSSSLSSSSSSDPFTPSFSFSSFYVRNYLISILRSVLFGSQPILKLPLPSVAKFKGKKKVPETLYTLTSWKQINIFTFLFWYFLDGFLEDEEISRKEKAKEVEENESKKDETKENLDDLKNELIGVEEKEEKEEKADEEEKLEEQEEQKKECLKDVTDVLDAEESEQHKEEKEASDETSNKQLHSDSMRPNIVHLDEADPLELVTAQQVSKCAHFLVNLIDKSCALKDLLNIGKRRAQDSCARETEGEEAKVSYEDYLANPSKGSKCEAKRHSKETQIDLTPLFFSPEMAHTRRLLPCFDLSDPLSSSSAQADSLSTTLDEAVFLQNESKHRWVQEKELARIKENRLIQWSGVRKGPPLRKSEQKMNALALFQMREGHHSRTHTRIVVDHSSKVWKNRTETRMSSRNKKQEVDSMLDYDDYHSAEITIGKAAKAHDFEDNWSDY
ncbi:uncharacterized protein MONOS_13771 [Monocercomonoides exilis]|uniref:uncharacterized protein n=1 Tax=Monocercomonoides exilis TaxID=2049356 RepID=UPI003559E50A|nr:hypothetical protein MONOS_13771 [Monocercomonoides exilis]|eukprot:MONOS_13771.1-p1 / transcript=MONOS_13771.1 / gene=MONOS_13771 / organism=Monocercomonoides_exilis_PA203 / gene_product=unspecified product / transcript_product=unspecified product / location=Mono_scaffold00880:14046-16046(-) / protein_length=667 / sequence_SO=supercontig / SO=protein_coding / is_pseudo=false